MIKEKFQALREILLKKDKLIRFNEIYRSGPDLYFYKRIMDINFSSKSIEDFLGSNYHIELIYATLVSWDMNSRGAKMEYFDEFKKSLLSAKDRLSLLWRKQITNIGNIEEELNIINEIYDHLNLMKTQARLVSNSKVMHFILPELLMPMDRQNTIMYFYNNTNDTKNKYLSIIRGSFEFIQQMGGDWKCHIDKEWNRTIPKVLDNAIIMKNDKSVKSS